MMLEAVNRRRLGSFQPQNWKPQYSALSCGHPQFRPVRSLKPSRHRDRSQIIFRLNKDFSLMALRTDFIPDTSVDDGRVDVHCAPPSHAVISTKDRDSTETMDTRKP